MRWAILLKTEDEWYLFKDFKDLTKAIQSHERWRATGFDCLLVFVAGPHHISDILQSLN